MRNLSMGHTSHQIQCNTNLTLNYWFFSVCRWIKIKNQLESVQLRRHCNSKATPTSRQSIPHIISIFCFFLFENIAFWEVPRGNHKCRSRGATSLVNNKLESVQLQNHCISNAERHYARRSGFFGLVWFENIVFGRFANCAWQPPRVADPPTRHSAHVRWHTDAVNK